MAVCYLYPEAGVINSPYSVIAIDPDSGKYHGILERLRIILELEQFFQTMHLHHCIGGKAIAVSFYGGFFSVFFIYIQNISSVRLSGRFKLTTPCIS